MPEDEDPLERARRLLDKNWKTRQVDEPPPGPVKVIVAGGEKAGNVIQPQTDQPIYRGLPRRSRARRQTGR